MNTHARTSSSPVHELKFPLTAAQAAEIRAWARRELNPDPLAQLDADDCYRTSSLYFDTPQFDVLCRRGSYGRSKYRVRRYGAASELFLERKMKHRDVVRKWRTIIPADSLDHFGHTSWFGRRISARALSPVCEISYRRLARVGVSELGQPIRLTLDDQLQAARTNGLQFVQPGVASPLPRIQAILELKYRQPMPEVFTRLIAEFGLVQNPVSKYRTAAAALGYGAQLTHA
ncbi:MAG: polyphosphate polymerase domain-containing protein [Bryobacteraceae bacterium]|nr:polyphosphate polymerase domain-containing protein [Bryobacteraceae bacterium]